MFPCGYVRILQPVAICTVIFVTLARWVVLVNNKEPLISLQVVPLISDQNKEALLTSALGDVIQPRNLTHLMMGRQG